MTLTSRNKNDLDFKRKFQKIAIIYVNDLCFRHKNDLELKKISIKVMIIHVNDLKSYVNSYHTKCLPPKSE